MVPSFKSVDESLVCGDSNVMKAIQQGFHVVLFIMLSKVVLVFKPVDEALVCNLHSNQSCFTVYFVDRAHYARNYDSNSRVYGK